jgi:hypothetical protein
MIVQIKQEQREIENIHIWTEPYSSKQLINSLASVVKANNRHLAD